MSPVTTESFNGAVPQPSAGQNSAVEPATAWEIRHEAAAYRLERVQAKADNMEPGRAAATAAAGLFVGLAWVIGRVWKLVWRSLAFAVAAWQVGWHDGTGRGPTKNELLQQNADLRTELARWSGDEHAAAVIGSRRK